MKYLQRENILHRAWAWLACGLVCISMLGGWAAAQQRQKQKTPRALALVEWPAKGEPRVVPIAILMDGHFYDASIYMADPVPMALDYGNVYEVEKSGEPEGFVTINLARQNANGQWTGTAKFQTMQAIQQASTHKEEPAVRPDPVQGPPKLTRGDQPSSKPATTAGTAPQPTQSKSDDDRPRLQKPAESTNAQPSQNQTDEGRPRLEKPADSTNAQPAAAKPATVPSAEAKPAPAPEDSDYSGRPRLRRGKPIETSTESAPAPAFARTSTATTGARSTQALAGAPVKILPAISDAGGPEPRTFAMPGNEIPREQLMSGMQELARAALQKYADGHGGANAGPLEDVEVRAFDLSLANQATVVLTASAHPAAMPAAPVRRGRKEIAPPTPPVDASLTYWITIVARENYNGEMRQLQAWATDNRHLDAYPRMEFIDAVDADGDGRGELLFRAINDLGRSFVIYRVSADELVALYDSSQLAE